jgi:hypothetical protein
MDAAAKAAAYNPWVLLPGATMMGLLVTGSHGFVSTAADFTGRRGWLRRIFDWLLGRD